MPGASSVRTGGLLRPAGAICAYTGADVRVWTPVANEQARHTPEKTARRIVIRAFDEGRADPVRRGRVVRSGMRLHHLTSTPSRTIRPCRMTDGCRYVAAPYWVEL